LGGAGCALPLVGFVRRAVEQMSIWAETPNSLAEASRRARHRFVELHDESRSNLDRLLATILADGRGGAIERGAHSSAGRK
jgi:hypothetical protein